MEIWFIVLFTEEETIVYVSDKFPDAETVNRLRQKHAIDMNSADTTRLPSAEIFPVDVDGVTFVDRYT